MEDRSKRLQDLLAKFQTESKPQQLKQRLEGIAEGQATPQDGQLESNQTSLQSMEATRSLEALDRLERGQSIDGESQFMLEAIVMPYYRPVVDVHKDAIIPEQLSDHWSELSQPKWKSWIHAKVRAVGRLEAPGVLYAGSAFLVARDLLMTNRHVAIQFAQGLGHHVQFQPGLSSQIDFYRELGSDASLSLRVERVEMIHPYWDMAILRVAGVPADRTPLKLAAQMPKDLPNHKVVVIGYPGFDPNGNQEYQQVQARIFRGNYYVKRFQPGQLREIASIRSYSQKVDALTHDCSTLGGNSGSAVIDLETGHVVGLHFAGAYLQANYSVPSWRLAEDPQVVRTGVQFEGTSGTTSDFYEPFWQEAQSSDRSETPSTQATPSTSSTQPPAHSVLSTDDSHGTKATVAIDLPEGQWTHVDIPIEVHLRLKLPTTAKTATGERTQEAKAAAPRWVEPAQSLEGLLRKGTPAADVPGFDPQSLDLDLFSWRTALSAVIASKLAYEDADAIEQTVRQRWRMNHSEFIQRDKTECFLAWNDRQAILAFRGTQMTNLGDWLTDLNVLPITRDYGIVHRGFLTAFQVVQTTLEDHLRQLDGIPLVLTGHSLGGALATIAAAEWRGRYPIRGIYTFGQPAVGRSTFPDYMRLHYSSKFFRIVYRDDVVARVPLSFAHVGKLFRFDRDGDVSHRMESIESTPSELIVLDDDLPMLDEVEFLLLKQELLQEQIAVRKMQAQRGGLESIALPEGLIPRVSHHSLDRYIAAVRQKADGISVS
jgi:V8-like Glu-specific endopeptidase